MKTTKQKAEKTVFDFSEEERASIIQQAQETKGQQLTINSEGKLEIETELKKLIPVGIEDPSEKYKLYYLGIQRLLKKYLPTGKRNQMVRDIIYEEKNVFLTRGKRKDKTGIRGADSRMGFTSDAEIVLQIIIEWVQADATALELYNSIRAQAEALGYIQSK